MALQRSRHMAQLPLCLGFTMQDPLHRLFAPQSIAVFGASPGKRGIGALVYARLRSSGFAGPVVAINPRHRMIDGSACYPNISAVGEQVDLAVIATPAETVPRIIDDCATAGTHHAVILSSGFGEARSDGVALGDRLATVAKKNQLRFLGPNCVGFACPWVGLDTTFIEAKVPKGNLAFVSQSGALCSAIADWAAPHEVGFSGLVSMGNMIDIGVGDVLRYFATDLKTGAILLYIESIRDASTFLSALRQATFRKPVIILKAGRHGAAQTAARTHTGALMGSDAVFDAAIERCGAIRVQSLAEMFAAAEILATGQRSIGPRLGIITNGGGAGILAADRAGDAPVDMAEVSDVTLRTLDSRLKPFWSRANPLDILGDATADDFKAAVTACLDDSAMDGLLTIVTPQAMTNATEVAKAVISVHRPDSQKPVLACWMGETSVRAARHVLSSAGIPDFDTPESAVEAFAFLELYRRNRILAIETPAPRSDLKAPDYETVHRIIDAALAQRQNMLSSSQATRLAKAVGIPVPDMDTATSAAQAVKTARSIGFPVVMKISADGITHKSEVDGVRLDLRNARQVRQAYAEITAAARKARPDARVRGVTIEAMVQMEAGREILIGSSRDPVFGTTLTFGTGGTEVELWRDTAVALPPLNSVLAKRLVERTRAARHLEPFRNLPAANMGALIQTLLLVSDLVVRMPEIVEMDLNPIVVGPEGVMALDVRIAINGLPVNQTRTDHLVIGPYPYWLEQEVQLRDGASVFIRPIRPDDAEREATFISALPPQTRRLRFLGATKQLNPESLARFTQIDYREEIALIASIEQNDTDLIKGIARFVTNKDRTSGEFAIVVSDDFQRKGLGKALMHALIESARETGLHSLRGEMLKTNKGMRQLAKKLGFRCETCGGEMSTIVLVLDLQKPSSISAPVRLSRSQ